MLGLIFRSIEGFVRQTYGDRIWCDASYKVAPNVDQFEPLFKYSPDVAQQLVSEISKKLDKTPSSFLEDFGTFMVTNTESQRVRRLLRFGGVDFTDFLHSLEDLKGRATLAMPDLRLPDLELNEAEHNHYILNIEQGYPGYGYFLLGVLRALADDYGALVFLDRYQDPTDDVALAAMDDGLEHCDQLSIQLVDMSHAEAKEFQLGANG